VNSELRICEAPKFIFIMSTEFLKLDPHLVYIPSANRIIRNIELERLGQGIIILQFEVQFDIYGATLVNHDKPVMVLGLLVLKREFPIKQRTKGLSRMFGVANSGCG
jgi:hypothetical protein